MSALAVTGDAVVELTQSAAFMVLEYISSQKDFC